MSKDLFPSRRVCVICGHDAPLCQMTTPKPGEAPMLGVYVTIYRRTAAGRQFAAAGKIIVCEPCLLRISAEGATGTIKGRALGDALLSAISKRVVAMCDEEPARRRFNRTPKGDAA